MVRSILPAAMMLALSSVNVQAQYTPPDPGGLEGIIVERYYVTDANDAADTDGGTGILPVGSTVYRVYVDMREAYLLSSVGGYVNHPLTFHTTTWFFNNEDRGEAWADDINDIYLDQNTVAIDSWLAMGACSDAHWGVLKSEDPDGSIVGGANNDGGSNSIPGGLLVNSVPGMGDALTAADGIYQGPMAPGSPVSLGEAPTIFNEPNGSDYSSEDFAYGVLSSGGVSSPLPGNKVLIGQFTTDGDFTFCLNLYVKIPDSLVCASPSCHEQLIFYPELIASDTLGLGTAGENKFAFPALCFNSATASFDCLGIAGGAALPGTACDDGDPDTSNDIYNAQCACAGIPTSVDENSIAARMSVYPNPAHDQIQLTLQGLTGERLLYELTDAVGHRVLGAQVGSTSGSWSERIAMEDLGSGIYFLTVTIGDRTHTERVILAR